VGACSWVCTNAHRPRTCITDHFIQSSERVDAVDARLHLCMLAFHKKLLWTPMIVAIAYLHAHFLLTIESLKSAVFESAWLTIIIKPVHLYSVLDPVREGLLGICANWIAAFGLRVVQRVALSKLAPVSFCSLFWTSADTLSQNALIIIQTTLYAL